MTPLDVLKRNIAENPYRFAFRVIEPDFQVHELRFRDVHRLMAVAAEEFRQASIAPGARVVLALPTSRALLGTYLAALSCGIHPVIVSAPQSVANPSHLAGRLRDLAERTEASAILCAMKLASELAQVEDLPPILDAAARFERRPAPDARALADVLEAPDPTGGIAHLQATSGSTGAPKAAVVTHENIAANVRAIGDRIGVRDDDLLVSWLPWSHDMGLIGLSYALYWDIPAVFSDPGNFVRRPLSWLRWISDYRGTVSPAPNHAFEMCARIAGLRPPRNLRLDHWRAALCGAEPVSEKTLKAFRRAFGPFGLSDTTLRPVYGLAEATLAVTIPPEGRRSRVDRITAGSMAAGSTAQPPREGGRGVSFVGLGQPIAGHELRIVSEDGAPLGERRIGEIEVRGPSVIPGYWNSEEDGAAFPHDDGFLRTGDLGYLADGDLFVTGRRKDLIILGGRNYTAVEIESFVEQVLTDGNSTPCVAVGLYDDGQRTEMLHLLMDARLAAADARRGVEGEVRSALAEAFGIAGIYVHWVNGGQIPRTPSGKVQRHLCRQMVQKRLSASTSGDGRAAEATGAGLGTVGQREVNGHAE